MTATIGLSVITESPEVEAPLRNIVGGYISHIRAQTYPLGTTEYELTSIPASQAQEIVRKLRAIGGMRVKGWDR